MGLQIPHATAHIYHGVQLIIMAGKKKSNYISYELKKLDSYVEQLQEFLDNNPPNLAVDRVERIVTNRGESIKVIASKEAQVKCFMDQLEKLPRLLEDLNRLRKEVDSDKKEVELRGGADRPGFMDDDDEEEEEQEEKSKKKNTRVNKKEDTTSAFDDDAFFEEEESTEESQEEVEEEDEIEQPRLKQLPPPDDEDEDDGDDSWLDERQ